MNDNRLIGVIGMLFIINIVCISILFTVFMIATNLPVEDTIVRTKILKIPIHPVEYNKITYQYVNNNLTVINETVNPQEISQKEMDYVNRILDKDINIINTSKTKVTKPNSDAQVKIGLSGSVVK